MENYTPTQQDNLFTPDQIKQLISSINSDVYNNYISYKMKKDFDEKIKSIMPSINHIHNPIIETNELLEQQNIKVDNLTTDLKDTKDELAKQTKQLWEDIINFLISLKNK